MAKPRRAWQLVRPVALNLSDSHAFSFVLSASSPGTC